MTKKNIVKRNAGLVNRPLLRKKTDGKGCRLCSWDIKYIDYKDPEFLKQFVNTEGKLLPRRNTELCRSHQTRSKQAVKRARIMAFLPFITDNLK